MSQAPDKTQLRHRMRTLRAEAAARDPDAAEKLADLFPMKLHRYSSQNCRFDVIFGVLKILLVYTPLDVQLCTFSHSCTSGGVYIWILDIHPPR